jgi:hypothetical protein
MGFVCDVFVLAAPIVLVTLLVVVFVVLCSSVWSFGSRFRNWRYIIARVSEMHVAYHKDV